MLLKKSILFWFGLCIVPKVSVFRNVVFYFNVVWAGLMLSFLPSLLALSFPVNFFRLRNLFPLAHYTLPWLSRRLFLDTYSPKKFGVRRVPVLATLVNHCLKEGKLTYFQKSFLSLLMYVKRHFLIDFGIRLQNLLNTTPLVPYRVSKIRVSNRVFYFPLPISTAKQLGYIYKKFALFLGFKKGVPMRDRLLHEVLLFLERDMANVLTQHLLQNFEVGFDNRMFLHYRWRFRGMR